MYLQIVVPTDGSEDSIAAFRPAKQLARVCDAPVVVIAVIGTDENPKLVEARLRERLTLLDPARDRIVIDQTGAPAAAIIAELERVPGSLLCMRSTGRSHVEPILGLVTESVLRATTGPAVLIGPHVDTSSWTLHGPMVVCADGSTTSHTIEPLAAQWGIAMGVDLTVCTVSDPDASSRGDNSDSSDSDDTTDIALPAHVARSLQDAIGRAVDYDSLHGTDVPRTIIRFAKDRDAGLIAAATHGHTGLKRLAMGSTTMSLVHHAHVPVLTQRPPGFAQEH